MCSYNKYYEHIRYYVMNNFKKLSDYDNKIEWLKDCNTYSKYFNSDNILKNMSIIEDYINTFTRYPTTKQRRYLELLLDFCLLYDEDILSKIKEYKNETSQRKKVFMRYGKVGEEEYNMKLKNRTKNTPNTWTMVSYWTSKGFSEKEAKQKIKDMYKETSKKGQLTRRGKNYKDINPLTIGYWLNRGYSNDESELMKIKSIKKIENSLQRYINDYGEDLGASLFKEASEKRKNTILNKYGSFYVNSNISKESLKVLVKLYKKLRKVGFSKDDMVWGISNKKEFVMTDLETKTSYFYDFVIKSKKIIVEYNNTFWHPRKDIKWDGIINYEKAFDRDIQKNKLAISRGYRVFYIWNDDNIISKINSIFEETLK